MLIKHTKIHQQTLSAFNLIVLCGDNPLCSDETLEYLSSHLQNNHPLEPIALETLADWQNLNQKLRNYTLFEDECWLHGRWDPKTIPVKMTFFEACLNKPSPPKRLLLQTPQVPIKAWQTLVSQPRALIVQFFPSSPGERRAWVQTQFRIKKIQAEPSIVEQLLFTTHGNERALMQAMQRIYLHATPGQSITLKGIEDLLFNDADYALSEFSEACLHGQWTQALHILHQSHKRGVALILLLGVYVRFLRQSIEVKHAMMQRTSEDTLVSAGIWRKYIPLYQRIVKPCTLGGLSHLLKHAQSVDVALKTQPQPTGLMAFEQLIQAHTLLSCAERVVSSSL